MLFRIQDWISNIGLIFLIGAVILWIFRFKKLPLAVRILGFYLLGNLIIQILADYLWQRSMNNLPLLHLNTIIEFVLISLFFKKIDINYPWFHNIFWPLVGTTLALLILNSIFLEPVTSFNSNAKTVTQIIFIAYVMVYFFSAFGRIDFSIPMNQSISLITFAILLYYSGSLFIFMFSNWLLIHDSELAHSFWIINAFLALVYQLLVLVAFVKLTFPRQI